MLTQEENDLLTKVGPGTPCGEMLRRYWYPVSIANELTDEHPTKFVRLLGEDLVLFKDKSGRIGLLADHCSHRGASLLYGRVEERGIACAYHGWLYDCEGNILETPPERNEAIMNSVKHTAYPAKTFIGMIWAYLGPLPAPVLPPYDVWVRNDGRRTISERPKLDCNWFQIMENSVDSAHAEILHQDTAAKNRKPVNSTRGFIDDIERYDYYMEDWGGLMKLRIFKNGVTDLHPLIFPNILRFENRTQIRVPSDDTHTMHFVVDFELTPDGSLMGDDEEPTVRHIDPFKTPADALYPAARFHMDSVQAQDYMVWETQGPIADRSREHIGNVDRGVMLLRQVTFDNIARVQQGLDPVGVVRDPEVRVIDTNLTESMALDRPRGIVVATEENTPASR